MTDGPAAEPPISVAVLGSCITRDSFNSRFNPGYKRWYRTVLMQNQSSLISVMSAPTPISEQQIGDGTDYDRWNVRTDFSKEFLDELPKLAPDYLILDFFGDIHFGVLEVAPGRWVTDNRWKLWPTPFYQALAAAGPLRTLRIERDTDDYLLAWRESLDRLAALVRRVVPETTVIVHRGHSTGLLRLPGVPEPVSLQEHRKLRRIDVDRLNALWSELDDYAVESTGWASIDLTKGTYPTFDGHPWGPYYVHYALDYYHDFLAELNAIHLGRVIARADPRWVGMVDEILTRSRADTPPAAADPTPAPPAAATKQHSAGGIRAVRRQDGTQRVRARVTRRVRSLARRVRRLVGHRVEAPRREG